MDSDGSGVDGSVATLGGQDDQWELVHDVWLYALGYHWGDAGDVPPNGHEYNPSGEGCLDVNHN